MNLICSLSKDKTPHHMLKIKAIEMIQWELSLFLTVKWHLSHSFTDCSGSLPAYTLHVVFYVKIDIAVLIL